jgi:alkylated DNA nucleotide flippase Atl1
VVTHSASFTEAVLALVEEIPPGHVASYGDLAAMLGSHGARAVGQVMAYSNGAVPWWRVVRADGSPPPGHEAEALGHYEAEDTPLRSKADGSYRVDIRACRWDPFS